MILITFWVFAATLLPSLTGAVLPLWVTAALSGITLLLSLVAIGRSPQGVLSITGVFWALYASVQAVFLLPLLNPGVLISLYCIPFQREELYSPAAQLGLLGLAAFLLGWLFCRQWMSSEAVHVPRSVPGPSGTQGFRFAAEPIRFWATIAAAAVFLLMAAPRATILSVGYMQIQSLSSIRLNVLRSGGNLLVLYSLVMCMMKPTARRWLVWGLIAAFSTIYVGFLAGNRVETLGLLAGLSIAVQRRRGRRIPFWPVFLGGTLLYGILQAVGKIRLGATWQPESLLRLAASGSAMSFTQGDVALTTMVTLDLLKNELLHFDGGLVFLNILKATLPVFITPDRPISFAEVLNQLARTAGGSFVINEPFLAWGPLGIAACLAFLGALLAYLDFRPHRQLGLILFFTAVAGMPRLLLYGWAAFYKYLLTGAILYFGILWLSELLYFGTLSARLAGLRRDSGHRNLS